MQRISACVLAPKDSLQNQRRTVPVIAPGALWKPVSAGSRRKLASIWVGDLPARHFSNRRETVFLPSSQEQPVFRSSTGRYFTICRILV